MVREPSRARRARPVHEVPSSGQHRVAVTRRSTANNARRISPLGRTGVFFIFIDPVPLLY